MEELKSCFFFWLEILVCGEKVENEGRCVPTSNSAREERGELEDLENRALEYILYIYLKVIIFLRDNSSSSSLALEYNSVSPSS